MADYLNPTSIRPDFDTKMGGFLGGMMAAKDRMRYENVASLQDLMQSIEAQKSVEDFTKGMPVRAAEREAKIAQFPLDTTIKRNQAEQGTLQTDFTRQTQPGKIGLTNAQSQTALTAQKFQELQQGLAVSEILAQIQPGPDFAARAGAQLKQMGISPDNPVLRGILATTNPAEIGPRARQAYQAINQHLQDYRSMMDKEHTQGMYGLLRQALANQGGVAAASAGRNNKSPEQLMMESSNAQELVTRALAIYRNSQAPAHIREMAKKAIEDNWEAYTTLVQKNELPLLPGLTPKQPLQNPTAPNQPQRPGGGSNFVYDPKTGAFNKR